LADGRCAGYRHALDFLQSGDALCLPFGGCHLPDDEWSAVHHASMSQ
jgi:hypothetical protein